MTHSHITRAEARRLRAEGALMKEIASRLGVSQSAVSYWCRGIKVLRGAATRNAEQIKRAWFAGKTRKEIAEALGVSEATIIAHLQHARARGEDWAVRRCVQRQRVQRPSQSARAPA
jgi:DNA-binding CsgD family transcriptional regulator